MAAAGSRPGRSRQSPDRRYIANADGGTAKTRPANTTGVLQRRNGRRDRGGITDLRLGDRVASNGPHAEVVCVARNLVAPVPDGVSDEDATFAVIGSVCLHAIRLLAPTLDETVVVVGLGLVGLLTADLLRINGCRVIGIEPDEAKRQLAQRKGITAPGSVCGQPGEGRAGADNGVGTDGVVIATSTQSNQVLARPPR